MRGRKLELGHEGLGEPPNPARGPRALPISISEFGLNPHGRSSTKQSLQFVWIRRVMPVGDELRPAFGKAEFFQEHGMDARLHERPIQVNVGLPFSFSPA